MIQRRKTFFDNINAEKIEKLIGEITPYLNHRKELYTRYIRKDDINAMMGSTEDATALMYEKYITNMSSGLLSGKPPTFTVTTDVKEGEDPDTAKQKAEQYQDFIDSVLRYNNYGSTNTKTTNDYLVKTAGYIYIYENHENEIVFTVFDSLSSCAIYDYNTPPNIIAFVRTWVEIDDDDEEQTMVEIITENYRKKFDEEGNLVPYDIEYDFEEILWGKTPVISFEQPDGIAVFEPAIPLIDNSETVVANIYKALKYNDQAKLVVSGLDREPKEILDFETNQMIPNPKRLEDDEELLNSPIVFLVEGGDLEWLLKNINFDGSLSFLKNNHNLIMVFTGCTDIADEAIAKASSGEAISYTIYGTEQMVAAPYEKVFKEGWRQVIELITERYNQRHGTEFDFRDVDISFERNIASNQNNKMQAVTNAYEKRLLSQETALDVLDIDIDVQAEIARTRDEKIKIQSVRDLREAISSDPPLVSHKMALTQLWGEKVADDILKDLETEKEKEPQPVQQTIEQPIEPVEPITVDNNDIE